MGFGSSSIAHIARIGIWVGCFPLERLSAAFFIVV